MSHDSPRQASATRDQPWLEGLNPAQLEAASQFDGPLLVLSGAGTGKTRVLTSRLVNLLASGAVKPWNILAVTFTNKAAREMKERVAAMIGPAVEQVWFGTFHSIGARILRRHAECVGLKPNFTILDTDDQLRLVKQLLEIAGVDPKRYPPRAILGAISGWKDKALTPDQVPAHERTGLADGSAGDLYQQYQQRLLDLNACDFGDLLLHNLTIFNQHPDILAEYHDRLTHLMVDEYQDTNVAQYLWLRALAQKHRNLCCVGDDDQSIYGWRGAEIANMLKFQEIYPEASVVRLEENYRSTGHILDAASAVIANNTARLGKTLFTSGDQGRKVVVHGYWDGAGEARGVSDGIEGLVRRGEARFDDIAVLVRAGYQTREFEERFIKIGLPYRVVGAKFYERQEIRDALAYLRVIAQPADDLALERIINTPRRGIGNTTVEAVRRRANDRGIPMMAAAEDLIAEGGLKAAASRSLADLVNAFIGWHEAAKTMPHTELAMQVLDESGYTAFWQSQKTPDAEGRLENLKELVSAMGEFDNLQGFLEHISLVMDGDNSGEEGEVMLMTLHAAKGLEFDTVFLVGWEEEVFPSQRSLNEKGGSGLEEERRLAYVGITRARERLQISWASSRRIHGRWQSSIPSRFILELPDESIIEEMERGMPGFRGGPVDLGVRDFASGGGRAGRPGYGHGWERARQRAVAEPVAADVPGRQEFVAGDDHDFGTGDRIRHAKLGLGFVLSVDGARLFVDFDDAGKKHVEAGYVSLAEGE